MRARRTAGALAVVLALVGAASGCNGSDASAVQELTPGQRGAPVDSSGPAVDGGTLDLASYRGKVTVVNVWWSGCGPCIKEMPLLAQAVAQLGPDVALVGINTRDSSVANAAAFESGLDVDFPSIFSPGGTNLADFQGKLNPRNIPSTLVLDREGRVAALISGEIPSKLTLVDVVQQVLDDPAAGASS